MGVCRRAGPGIKDFNFGKNSGVTLSRLDTASHKDVFSEYGASKGTIVLQLDGTAYDSTAGVVNMMYTGQGNRFCFVAPVQADIEPVTTATGLNIAGDQTANDGFEMFAGVNGATGRPFIIGDDPAFYFECKFVLGDASGSDDLQIGFRRPNVVSAFDDYLDAATLGCNTSADPMAIKIATILNNGATSETDTTNTLADSVEAVWRINVSSTGVVTYQINGASPTVTAAFTFDDGDPVIPFVKFIHDNDVVDTFNIIKWEVGYL